MLNKKITKIIILLGLCFSQTRPQVTTPEINTKITENNMQKQTVDLIIISENNPQYLREMIKSIFEYVPDIEKIYVLKDPCYGQYRDLYNSIKADYDPVEFIKVGPSNFKSMLESIISLSHNKHVLLSRSNIIFTGPVDLNGCIKAMDNLHANSFCLASCENTQENQKITSDTCVQENLDIIEKEVTEESSLEQENIFLWQFKNSQIGTVALNMTLYKKSDLLDIIKPMNYTSPQELLDCWNNNLKINK